ncbi:MAG: hypothetical protein WBZ40_10250 [Acidimicrobiia bacterium]
MPVVDSLAAEYADRVDFVAPAWKSDFASTSARAEELFKSGQIKWGLDQSEEIFARYGVPYQPVTVLIGADDTVVESWPGLRDEAEIREAIEDLIAIGS